jgi:hypothetical protein
MAMRTFFNITFGIVKFAFKALFAFIGIILWIVADGAPE